MLEQMKVQMHIHEDDSTLIRKSKAISDDLNKRYLDKQQMLLKCSFLDPRFKDLAWVPEAGRADTLEELVSEALDLAPTSVKIKQEPQDVAQSTSTPTQQNPSLPPLPTYLCYQEQNRLIHWRLILVLGQAKIHCRLI